MNGILTGIKNFLELINENWTLITVIIGLGILVFNKVKGYLSLSDQEKIDLALEQVRIVVLEMVAEAEIAWSEYKKAGSIKRSEVIKRIFDEYPVLSKFTDQEQLLNMLDEMIDESLVTLRQVIEENTKTNEENQ